MKNVGGIVENPDLYKRMSGRENLKYYASMHSPEAAGNIENVVNMVKMSERINDKVKTYSLGMKQRVGLAQALLHMPPLLVLDEPTNGLDPIGIKELRDLLRTLAKESGVGVFISSHLLSEMEQICTRIYIVDNGVIIGEKSIDELKDQNDDDILHYLFVTNKNEDVYKYFKELDTNCNMSAAGVSLVMKTDEIPKIIRKLVEMEIDIYAVNQQHRSLEQDFISITTGTKTQIQ
jgi:ABC-2 type transport system ATP-binding protein